MGKDYVNKKRGPILMNDFDNAGRGGQFWWKFGWHIM